MTSVEISTYLSPAKPIPSTVPGWEDARQATWPATTSSLLTVDGGAVLVDSLMTLAEGAALAEWIGEAGHPLHTVYVTHAHADHFFGATSLLDSLPSARLVTRPEIVEAALVQTAPGYLRVWSGFFPGQIADAPRTPEALVGSLFTDASVARAVLVGQSDVEVSSVVHVPDLGIVVAGDVVYNDVHLWLAGSTPMTRSAWLAALDTVEQLAPRTIIAGHRAPDASDDDASRLLAQTRHYIQDFDDAVAVAGSARDLVDLMLARYRDLQNVYTLWVAASSQFGT